MRRNLQPAPLWNCSDPDSGFTSEGRSVAATPSASAATPHRAVSFAAQNDFVPATSVNSSIHVPLQLDHQLECLLHGQRRLEGSLEDVKHSLHRLPEVLLQQHQQQQQLHQQATLQLNRPSQVLFSGCLNQTHTMTSSHVRDGFLATDVSPVTPGVASFNESASLTSPSPLDGRRSGLEPSGTVAFSSADAARNRSRSFDMGSSGGPFLVPMPHALFQELAAVVQQNDFTRVRELTRAKLARSKTGSEKHVNLASVTRVQASRFRRFPTLPMHPTSLRRTVFDCLSMLMLMFDSMFVPFVIAWDISLRGPWRVVGWSIAIFWTVDLLLNFVTGYSTGSQVVMSLKSISRRYLRSGFFVDLTVLLLDYIDLVALALFPDLKASGSSIQSLKNHPPRAGHCQAASGSGCPH